MSKFKKTIILAGLIFLAILIFPTQNVHADTTWSNFTNATYTLKTTNELTGTDSMVISGVTKEEGRKFYYKITSTDAEPTIEQTSENELSYYNGDHTFSISDFSRYIELNQNLYLWILEKDISTSTTKMVVSAKKIERPTLSKKYDIYGDGTLISSMLTKIDYTPVPRANDTHRTMTFKIGKITNTTILQKIKDNDDSGWENLLTLAKTSTPIYTGGATLEGDIYTKSEALTIGDSIVANNYYYLYTIFDDENGKYYPIEGVTVAKANVPGAGMWDLDFYGTSNFSINLDNPGGGTENPGGGTQNPGGGTQPTSEATGFKFSREDKNYYIESTDLTKTDNVFYYYLVTSSATQPATTSNYGNILYSDEKSKFYIPRGELDQYFELNQDVYIWLYKRKCWRKNTNKWCKIGKII